MSNFIIPMSSLPTISSVTDLKGKDSLAGGAVGGSVPFADMLQKAFDDMSTTGAQSSENRYNLALGNSDDMHTTAIDSLKYSTAVSFASGVTRSVVNAYNELLRMNI